MATHEEALKDSLEYFNGNNLAATAFVGKYALKDNSGNWIETNPDQMHHRLAKELARIEAKYPNGMSQEAIYELMRKFKKIIPQGSPMYGIGNPYQVVSLGNCFVVPSVHDSISGIGYSDQQLANLFKRRCGVGIDVSNIRPKDTMVRNAAGTTTGIATFMEKFSETCRGIGQCIAAGERVLTKRGLIAIENVKPEQDFVWTKVGWVQVLNVVNNGVKEVFSMKTSRGYSIKTSKDHVFLDGDTLEEKQLEEFTLGDSVSLLIGETSNRENNSYVSLQRVVVENNNGQLNTAVLQPTALTEDLAYFLGYAYGDGYVTRNRYGEPVSLSLACSNKYPAIKVQLENISKNVFGVELKKTKGDGDLECLDLYSKVALTQLESNSLLKQKSAELTFPEAVVSSPPSVQAAFLSGYFDADGYASGKKKGYSFSSVSQLFLENVQTVLLGLGIVSRMHSENREGLGWKTLFSLNVTGTSSQTKLVELFERSIKVSGLKHISHRDNVLTPWKPKAFDIDYNKHNYINKDQQLSVSAYNKYVNETNREALPKPMFFDEIVSIEFAGMTETYDLVLGKEHLFWCEGFYVHNSGRRGALMLTISCHHPEIRTFISIKKNLDKVTGANISIRFTNEFMNAVKENKEVQLRWPVDSKTPKISKMVNAKEVWEEFVEAAWQSAEPGCLFWDTILQTSTANQYPGFEEVTCNPCQPGWATVLTPEGIRTLGQIEIGSTIWSGKRWTKVTNKVCTGVKQVNAYRTTAGVFYGTENHRVVSNGHKVEVGVADSIDAVQCSEYATRNAKLDPQAVMDGLVFGDGIYHKASRRVFLSVGEDDKCYFDSEIKNLLLEARPGVTPTAWAVNTRIELTQKTYDRAISLDWLTSVSEIEQRGFLRGLYSANGSVVNNRVTLKSASKKLVEQVQVILSSLGIASYYTTNESHEVEFQNGVYECKESYDLNIGTLEGRKLFSELIGFIHPEKTQKLLASLDTQPLSRPTKTNFDIISVENLGEELVYDITVEADEHTYWTGGLLVSNCSEIVMNPDSCRLLLVNAFGFVKNPFSRNKASFDFEDFAATSYKAQRLMDDIVDLEIEKIDEILKKINDDPEPYEILEPEKNMWRRFKESAIKGRRTGLGLTAVGDVLAALGIRYGSQESIEFVEKLYRELELASVRSSVDMAEERGAFPMFDIKKDLNGSEYLKKVLTADDVVYQKYLKVGRRNIANTTTPPAGTTSLLACLSEPEGLYGTTSGIEPAFLISYKRRKKINPSDTNAKVDFIDNLGDRWTEFEVKHAGFELWQRVREAEANRDKNGMVTEYIPSDPEDSPYWKSTSADVDWRASVDLQAAAQKWIDHAISKTCNLPASATKELVDEVYMKAWNSGCKGFTIYRDGSRSGVLVSSDTNKQQEDGTFIQHNAPKRPKELPCDIYHSTVNGEKWTIFVGLMDEKPYEIMGGLAKFVKIPRRVTKGKLVKHNGDINPARYDLHYDFDKSPEDETVIQDVGNVFENPTNSGFTRILSLALRHGAPVQYAVEQLVKAGDKESDLWTVTKAFSRVLKNYVKDGTKVTSIKKCKSCGSDNLAYKEGCVQCMNCGDSKCS